VADGFGKCDVHSAYTADSDDSDVKDFLVVALLNLRGLKRVIPAQMISASFARSIPFGILTKNFSSTTKDLV